MGGIDTLFSDISGGGMNKHLFIPGRTRMAEQKNDVVQLWLSEPVSLRGLLKGI